MNNLKTFSSEEATVAAEAVKAEMLEQTYDQNTLERVLSFLVFRDETGNYLALDPVDSQWYAFRGGAFAITNAPSGRVEGPAILDTWLPRQTSRHEPTLNEPVDTVIEFMVENARSIQTSYREGEITLWDANSLLKNLMLLDESGAFWVVGVQSLSWYQYSDEGWRKQGQPPIEETLVDNYEPEASENLTEVDERVLNFFLGDACLPESVTQVWDGPEGFPQPISQCPSCNFVWIGSDEKCLHCDRNFESKTASNIKQLSPSPARDTQLTSTKANVKESKAKVVSTNRFCTGCGVGLTAGQSFCTNCGQRVPTQDETVQK